MVIAQDSELTAKMKDGDVEGLAQQNMYLKEALEACRKQITELTQQVSCKNILTAAVLYNDPFCGSAVLFGIA